MTDTRILYALNDLDQDLIAAAAEDLPPRKRHNARRYASFAAALLLCLGTVLLFLRPGNAPQETPSPQPDPTPTTPSDSAPSTSPDNAGDAAPHIIYEGEWYGQSPLGATVWDEELPKGYAYAGTTEDGYPYYTNPDALYRIYVYHKVALSQPASSAKWEERYVPYVHESVRGSWLLSYEDTLYIRLLDAEMSFYTDHHAISDEANEQIRANYDRSLTEIPAGFTAVGLADAVDYNTIPTGALCGNHKTGTVYVNEDEPDIVLVTYNNYEVYVRYGLGLSEQELLPWFRTQP